VKTKKMGWNSNYSFNYMEGGNYGGVSDGGVFAKSYFKSVYKQGVLMFLEHFMFVAGYAFPLRHII
jgi:hypothetical protein